MSPNPRMRTRTRTRMRIKRRLSHSIARRGWSKFFYWFFTFLNCSMLPPDEVTLIKLRYVYKFQPICYSRFYSSLSSSRARVLSLSSHPLVTSQQPLFPSLSLSNYLCVLLTLARLTWTLLLCCRVPTSDPRRLRFMKGEMYTHVYTCI